ncbi:monocyte chemotactic protein 1B-like [Sinocyclocheilus rhinocerous]|uniref:Monocyte chemotactic protein 1B-like n=1 Tax=Sinocyclocheilus rhinocerous TaxID=307959 RepID=A0A673JNH6_9TELE|nr:PREDICTED: monocyte chemotactic protein 1B-like [Sinocyclocheilus rhinocerous]
MRSLMCVLFLVLFCSVQMTSSAPHAIGAQSNCCVEFKNVRIPIKQVVSYYWTSSNCAKRAIVFKTVVGREICVDPETTWVNHHVDKVDKKTTTAAAAASTTSPTAKTQSLTI